MMNGTFGRKLRMGLFGGGTGSFIGKVHSIAAQLDNRAELVAGAFSSDADCSRSSASEYGVDPDRAYGSYQEFLEEESQREDGVDFVTIATPNYLHYEMAFAALEAGFHVFLDKPMTFDVEEAEALHDAVLESDCVFVLTHNYTGYPLVREARHLIHTGALGQINAVRTQYIQGWLRNRIEADGQKQAAWRTDPKRSGAAGAFGDIATHAYNLACFMTGEVPIEVSCLLQSFVEGRELDDYGTAILKTKNEGIWTVTASQISHGRANDLSIEVDGTEGSLSWRQENPNYLVFRRNGSPTQVFERDPNAAFFGDETRSSCRLPSGHPEAFFEAFANVYSNGFDEIVRLGEGNEPSSEALFPSSKEGLEGMRFIDACVSSSSDHGKWIPLGN